MRRRSFLAATIGATVCPTESFGQGGGVPRYVAILSDGDEFDSLEGARITSLRAGLQDFGWIDQRNVNLDVAFFGGRPQLLRKPVEALVTAQPDLIVVNSMPALDEVRIATRKIPVVFVLVVDPVRLGYVESLARPGANITGFSYWDIGLIGKWLQLLKEVAPSTERATLIHNPDNTPFYPQLLKLAQALPGLPVSVGLVSIRKVSAIQRTISELASQPGGSIVLPSDSFNYQNRSEIAVATNAARLPVISISSSFVQAGGLMAYGPDSVDIYRQAARYVDRILKGAKPAELPVQAPTKFEFSINVSTARRLGLTVPPSLFALASEVIE